MSEADSQQYLVVINDEEQYSIWRADRALPLGWAAIGDGRSKQACLDYIDQTWQDMRPLSLRNAMAKR